MHSKLKAGPVAQVALTGLLWELIQEALGSGNRSFEITFDEHRRLAVVRIDGTLLSTPEETKPRLEVALHISGDLAMLHPEAAVYQIGVRGRDA